MACRRPGALYPSIIIFTPYLKYELAWLKQGSSEREEGRYGSVGSIPLISYAHLALNLSCFVVPTYSAAGMRLQTSPPQWQEMGAT